MTSPFQVSATHILGADFLRFLLTPDSVDPDQPPTEEQGQELDFSRYGKTEAEIKQFLKQKAQAQSQTAVLSLTGYFYADLLDQAMAQGLIYRLSNPQEDGKAYYGIPAHVRETLSLEWQPEPESMKTLSELSQVKENRTALIRQLKLFLVEATATESLEIREYAAQVALNAVQQGDLVLEDVPALLQQFGQELGLVAVPHYAGLTVLLEACRETVLFKNARDLCDMAVDAHLLPAEDVEEILRSAQPKLGNPFMVLG